VPINDSEPKPFRINTMSDCPRRKRAFQDLSSE
ncbi:hypothetical protein GA0115233_10331, partial [Streptomyces sp. DI166]